MKKAIKKEDDFNLKQQNQVDSIFLEFLITNLFAEHKIFSTFTKFLPEFTSSQNYEIDGIFEFTKTIEVSTLKNFLLEIFSEKNIKASIVGEIFENSSDIKSEISSLDLINEGDFLIFETKLNPSKIQEEISNYDKISKIEKKISKSKKYQKSKNRVNSNKINFFLIFFYNINQNSTKKEKIFENFEFLKKIKIGSLNILIIFTDCKNVLRQTLKVDKVSVKTVVDLVVKVDNLENQVQNLNLKFEKLNLGFENILNEFNKKQIEKEKEIEDLKEINDMQEKIIHNYKTINKSVTETYKMIEDVNFKNEFLSEENFKLRKVCELNTTSKNLFINSFI